MHFYWSDPAPGSAVNYDEGRKFSRLQWLRMKRVPADPGFSMGMVYRQEDHLGRVIWRAYSNQGAQIFSRECTTEEEAKALLLCHVRLG